MVNLSLFEFESYFKSSWRIRALTFSLQPDACCVDVNITLCVFKTNVQVFYIYMFAKGQDIGVS